MPSFTTFLSNLYCLEIFHSMICISGCHVLTRKKAGCTSGCYTGTCRSICYNKKKHALCCGAFQVKQHGWKPHLSCCLFWQQEFMLSKAVWALTYSNAKLHYNSFFLTVFCHLCFAVQYWWWINWWNPHFSICLVPSTVRLPSWHIADSSRRDRQS